MIKTNTIFECSIEGWNSLMEKGLSVSGQTNTKFNFNEMCKRFPRAYLSYLEASYLANEGFLTDEEFCIINGNVPISFLKRLK